MFLLLTAVILGCDAFSPETLVKDQWDTYKLRYKKIYQGEIEEQYRLKFFMNNLYEINQHNKLYAMGAVTYKLGINQFNDLLHTEFLKMYATNTSEYKIDLPRKLVYKQPDDKLPEKEVDWRKKGAVTPVKDQGNCKSSWTFGATAAIEGQWFRKTGKLVKLSEQNIIDCFYGYVSHGCGGGIAYSALNYVEENRGIDTDSSYPYEAEYKTCRYRPGAIGATIEGHAFAEENNEGSLQSVIDNIGPAAALIDVSQPDFKKYSGGIYDNPSCEIPGFGHTVLVVGYGTEKGQDYWLVKNSWGISWGENGYIRMSRNKNNQCGIASMVVYPVV